MKQASYAALLLAVLGLVACGKKAEQKPQQTGSMVSVAQAEQRTAEQVEESVGEIESLASPAVAAEVAGRVIELRVAEGMPVKVGQVLAVIDAQDAGLTRLSAQAELHRQEALSANQARALERSKQLREKNFISQAALDEATAQYTASQEQLAAARAQFGLASRSVGKTQVRSPVEGRVGKQAIALGMYVKVGDPIFQVVELKRLRARLPFPEGLSASIRRGMPVRLTSPGVDGVIQGKVDEIRPMTGSGSRAFDVFVLLDNPGDLTPGATVNGAVVLGQREHAVMVPETSLVLRPAGQVVYEVKDGKAIQHVVSAGARQPDGSVEIRSGLQGGETVVTDGAGFLTDQAAVTIAKPAAK